MNQNDYDEYDNYDDDDLSGDCFIWVKRCAIGAICCIGLLWYLG